MSQPANTAEYHIGDYFGGMKGLFRPGETEAEKALIVAQRPDQLETYRIRLNATIGVEEVAPA